MTHWDVFVCSHRDGEDGQPRRPTSAPTDPQRTQDIRHRANRVGLAKARVTHTARLEALIAWAMIASSCCPPCCASCACNVHGNFCIQPPGKSGPRCDALSSWRASNSTLLQLQPLLTRKHRPYRGQNRVTVSCMHRHAVVEDLRVQAERWANRTWPVLLVENRTAADRRRAASLRRGCPGCRLPAAGGSSDHHNAATRCCSGRGECLRGWCACPPGTFGIDCAHGEPAGSQSTSARRVNAHHPSVAIYVYEMPLELGAVGLNGRAREKIYVAEVQFIESLLADSATRTLDPALADLFLVPFWSYHSLASNTGCDRTRLELVIRWLSTTYPYWATKGGADHVFWLTGDRGACAMQDLPLFKPAGAAAAPIFVTHFGLLGAFELMRQVATADHVHAAAREFAHLDVFVDNASTIVRKLSDGEWCHDPHKDVVAPPFLSLSSAQRQSLLAAAGAGVKARPAATGTSARAPLLFHAGKVGGWDPRFEKHEKWGRVPMRYSLGMRQRLYERFGRPASEAVSSAANNSSARGREDDGMVIVNGMVGTAYPAMLAATEFCLAPAGDGWGIRLVQLMAEGCVPLVAQPLVIQPLEGILDYESFSARLNAPREINATLPTRLAALVRSGEAARMRQRLREARSAFLYGERAYDATLLALCRRARELHGALRSGGSCAHIARRVPGASSAEHTSLPRWAPPALVEAVARLQRTRRQYARGELYRCSFPSRCR